MNPVNTPGTAGTDLFIAVITAVGSPVGAFAPGTGYTPHAWQEYRLQQNSRAYVSKEIGRVGTLTSQPAFAPDGSAYSASDFVLMRMRGNLGIDWASPAGSDPTMTFSGPVYDIICKTSAPSGSSSSSRHAYVNASGGGSASSSAFDFGVGGGSPAELLSWVITEASGGVSDFVITGNRLQVLRTGHYWTSLSGACNCGSRTISKVMMSVYVNGISTANPTCADFVDYTNYSGTSSETVRLSSSPYILSLTAGDTLSAYLWEFDSPSNNGGSGSANLYLMSVDHF